jgi:hypothetical protein
MTYDSVHRETVVFGGYGVVQNDMWTFDGHGWTQRSPAVLPPWRGAPAMFFDAIRGRVLLFGGFSATGQRNDTWEWDGTSWAERLPAHSPPALTSQKLGYSPTVGLILLQGIDPAGNPQTWEWDGTDWLQRFPAHQPPASGFGLAYDGFAQQTLLFGGTVAGSEVDHTWAWNGTDWTLLSPPDSPPARSHHAMAHASGLPVVQGGVASGTNLHDMWFWTAATWAAASPAHAPTARSRHGLADAPQGLIVLFGGGSDFQPPPRTFAGTWIYGQLTAPAAFDTVGTGCPGPGVPSLGEGSLSSLPGSGQEAHEFAAGHRMDP